MRFEAVNKWICFDLLDSCLTCLLVQLGWRKVSRRESWMCLEGSTDYNVSASAQTSGLN